MKKLLALVPLTLLACGGVETDGFEDQSEDNAIVAPTAVVVPRIDPAKELMIRDLSVVEDPCRTRPLTGRPLCAGQGAWTFGRLMADMAGAHDPAEFTERWLRQWSEDLSVNGDPVTPRPAIQNIIDAWPRLRDGRLDLARAPMRLLAIVSRVDLRGGGYSRTSAGEGRFVFGVTDAEGNPLQFTVIFEYGLPGADALSWARSWHALGALPFGPEYNAALQAITDRFAGKNADPNRVNGSSLNQLRTNEIALGRPWELREFALNPRVGLLAHTTLKQSPRDSINGTAALAGWINANESAILAGNHRVSDELLGGTTRTPIVWTAPRIRNPDARHKLAVATCGGCHQAETGTPFVHVAPRAAGQVADLSGFLTGITISDPVSGTPRTFNDLARRVRDMQGLLTIARPTDPVARTASTLDTARVH